MMVAGFEIKKKVDALYFGSFKRSINNNTSHFPCGLLKQLRNEMRRLTDRGDSGS